MAISRREGDRLDAGQPIFAFSICGAPIVPNDDHPDPPAGESLNWGWMRTGTVLETLGLDGSGKEAGAKGKSLRIGLAYCDAAGLL